MSKPESSAGYAAFSLPRWRRRVQVATLAALFVIPILNILKIHFIKGTFYSLDVGDLSLADPLAVFQAAFAARMISGHMLVSLAVPLLVLALFGRVWCSWFCPYYLLVDWLMALRRRLGLRELRRPFSPRRVRGTVKVRLLFFSGAVLLAGVAGIPLLNLISAPGIISSQMLVLLKFGYLTFEAAFIAALLIGELFIAHRFWCRFFCPSGTCLSLLRPGSGMRVAPAGGRCTDCGACTAACPMELDPRYDGLNQLCHNCGACIAACPENRHGDTLRFLFGPSRRRAAMGGPESRKNRSLVQGGGSDQG